MRADGQRHRMQPHRRMRQGPHHGGPPGFVDPRDQRHRDVRPSGSPVGRGRPRRGQGRHRKSVCHGDQRGLRPSTAPTAPCRSGRDSRSGPDPLRVGLLLGGQNAREPRRARRMATRRRYGWAARPGRRSGRHQASALAGRRRPPAYWNWRFTGSRGLRPMPITPYSWATRTPRASPSSTRSSTSSPESRRTSTRSSAT